MKNIKRITFLIVATALATAGFSAQAEQVSKKVIPDMSSKGQGSINLSIWCGEGKGGD